MKCEEVPTRLCYKLGQCHKYNKENPSTKEECYNYTAYKETTMEKIAIHVPTQKISESVQEALFDLGWELNKTEKRERTQPISYPTDTYGTEACVDLFSQGGNKIGYTGRRYYIEKDYKIITVTEFFDNLEKYRVKPKPEVVISREYKATDFTKEGFKVGCQTITWDMVDKINKIREGL